DRLHRRDRAVSRRRDAFLKISHFSCEGGLITHGARHAAKKRRDLRTSLGESENVVDEDENVRILLIAEVLGDRETREADAESRARRLVHLAIDQRDLIENPRFLELEVQVVPFARALAHTAEHRAAAVALGDVVDQLLDDDRLADARAAEESDLTALHE